MVISLDHIDATVGRIVEHVERTNGRVSRLELWQAELRGIAQGSGGTGRLFAYILAAGASAGTIVVAGFAIAGHLK